MYVLAQDYDTTDAQLLFGGDPILLYTTEIVINTLPSVFPTLSGVGWDLVKTTRWSTDRQEAVSGKSTRLSFWSDPLYDFELTYDFLRSVSAQDAQSLLGFFNARRGSNGAFIMRWQDDVIATNQILGVGDGVTTTYQLTRQYGGRSEAILAPINVGSILVDNVAVDATIHGFNSTTPGKVYLSSPPDVGSIVSVTSVEYGWPVIFDSDTLDLTMFAVGLYETKSVKFRGVRNI